MAGPLRQPIDVARLEAYCSEHVPGFKGPLDVKQFGFGQSNPTYLLTSTTNKKQYVMRKKPPGSLLSPSAHAVEREYRVIKAVHGSVPTPAVYCLCEDSSVIGTPFYVMEYIAGRIFHDFSLPGVSPSDRRAMWKSATETLAKLHSVDIAKVGLDSFGKSGGFYERQMKTLSRIDKSQGRVKDIDTGESVGEIPHMEEMCRVFRNNLPPDRNTVIHGDFKIDNMIFHPTEPRVVAVLDWEMSTLGHPLSDLANFTACWFVPQLERELGIKYGNGSDAFLPGLTGELPSREEVLGWYADAAGWDPRGKEMQFADGFALVRASIIFQGIAARYARRQASSAKAREMGENRKNFSKMAWEFTRRELDKGKGGSEVKAKL